MRIPRYVSTIMRVINESDNKFILNQSCQLHDSFTGCYHKYCIRTAWNNNYNLNVYFQALDKQYTCEQYKLSLLQLHFLFCHLFFAFHLSSQILPLKLVFIPGPGWLSLFTIFYSFLLCFLCDSFIVYFDKPTGASHTLSWLK